MGGRVPVANSFVNPLEPQYTRTCPSIPTTRRAPAALLAEAGWTPGPDGICRNAAGQRLSLQFSASTGVRARELQQQVMQSQWRSIGVETVHQERASPHPVRRDVEAPQLHRHGDVRLEQLGRELAAADAVQRADPDGGQQLGRR